MRPPILHVLWFWTKLAFVIFIYEVIFKTVRLVVLDTQPFFKFGLHAARQPAIFEDRLMFLLIGVTDIIYK